MIKATEELNLFSEHLKIPSYFFDAYQQISHQICAFWKSESAWAAWRKAGGNKTRGENTDTVVGEKYNTLGGRMEDKIEIFIKLFIKKKLKW